MGCELAMDRRIARPQPVVVQRSAGFTLIELMISMALSVLVLTALVGLFSNTSRNNAELSNMNSVIENGRFSMQLLEDDLVHAGYWGGYLPQFDDLISTAVPGDVPTIVPDVCAAYAAWNHAYRTSLIGISVQTYEDLPAGAGCLAPLVQRAGTDVLVVRHAEPCVPGIGTCGAEVAGRLYFQASLCGAEAKAGSLISATSNTVTFGAEASSVTNAYAGLTIRVGDNLLNSISAYNGATKVATLGNAWTTIPGGGTPYAFEYVLGTGQFPLHQRDCVGTGSPAQLPITAGTAAVKRSFVSNLYYVHDYPHPDRAGEVIPTLVRSRVDSSGGTPAHEAPVPLIGGVEGFRVTLGIDDLSDTGAPVDYTTAVDWADPTNKTSPVNRGDGEPDRFIRCTTAAPCTADDLANVVAAKLFVLARSRDPSPGHVDDRSLLPGRASAGRHVQRRRRSGPGERRLQAPRIQHQRAPDQRFDATGDTAMNPAVRLHRERGSVLIVGLVMLTFITVLVTNAFVQSTTNLKAVGNMQFRNEAIAAANKALEQVIDTPFAAAPSADEVLVDINNDGTMDYTVAVDPPTCIRADEFVVSGAAPSSITLGAAFAVAGSTFYQTVWDLNAAVEDEITGSSVQVRQGVRVLLTQVEYNAVCL